MNRNTHTRLRCAWCSSGALRVEEYEADGEQVHDGRMICESCGTWFRIENGVADLLPAHLRRTDLYERFAARHGIRNIGEIAAKGEDFKSSQIRFFKSHVDEYEDSIVNHPLYPAFAEHIFLRWLDEHVRPGDWVIDLGCGTGAPCLDLAKRGIHVLGIDIAEEMMIVGQRRAFSQQLDGLIDFIVADAENPPIPDASFNACVLLGALHHLPDPAKAIAAAARKLVPGGGFYSQDPHDSPVRFLFDWLMKIKKLYDEEARGEPLFSERQLLDLMDAAGFEGRTQLSIYLPPHLFGLMSSKGAQRLLEVTDALFGHVPGMRRCAGYVIAQGVKRA